MPTAYGMKKLVQSIDTSPLPKCCGKETSALRSPATTDSHSMQLLLHYGHIDDAHSTQDTERRTTCDGTFSCRTLLPSKPTAKHIKTRHKELAIIPVLSFRVYCPEGRRFFFF